MVTAEGKYNSHRIHLHPNATAAIAIHSIAVIQANARPLPGSSATSGRRLARFITYAAPASKAKVPIQIHVAVLGPILCHTISDQKSHPDPNAVANMIPVAMLRSRFAVNSFCIAIHLERILALKWLNPTVAQESFCPRGPERSPPASPSYQHRHLASHSDRNFF
jgi:hypothetical protein